MHVNFTKWGLVLASILVFILSIYYLAKDDPADKIVRTSGVALGTVVRPGGRHSDYTYGIYRLPNGEKVSSMISPVDEFDFQVGKTYSLTVRAIDLDPTIPRDPVGLVLLAIFSSLGSLVLFTFLLVSWEDWGN